MGGSSDLCTLLQPGEPVVVMGPTGTPSETRRRNGAARRRRIRQRRAVLDRPAFRRAGFTGAVLRRLRRRTVPSKGARSKRPRTQSSGPSIEESRSRRARAGSDVRRQHRAGDDGLRERELSATHGDSPRRTSTAHRHRLRPDDGRRRRRPAHGAPAVSAAGTSPSRSINSLMQCMMKEVCGAVPAAARRPGNQAAGGVVFSCFNQDQPMDRVDFANLRQRLKINSLSEKLAGRFLDVLNASAELRD